MKLSLVAILSLGWIYSFSQNYYVVDINNDTTQCQILQKNGTKCINGNTTTKFKSQEIISYKMGDTSFFAIKGFKRKRHIHGFKVISNHKYNIMQYDYMEAQTSGPSIPKTKYLICDSSYVFKAELYLNEKTTQLLSKYFGGCNVFDDELKLFASDQKRRFPLKSFKHLLNVYSNSCSIK